MNLIDADVVVTIPDGSQEPVVARLTSPTGELLDAAVVEVSAVPDGDPYAWVTAQWVETTPAATRTARSASARTWTTGTYVVHVRLDSAQIIRCSNTIQVP